VFVERNSNYKGAVAEAAIAAAATKLGVDVYRPLAAHGRYDLLFDLGARLLRIQCKWAARHGDVIVVGLRGSRYNANGRISSTYAIHEIDAVAAYCDELDKCYLVPIELVAGKHGISLRLNPPRNSQRAWLNWASDFEFSGAIAQLGERRAGSAKVGGSNPPSSTSAPEEIGAHEFRERLGWYLQRTSGGERIVITRRGKPFAHLESVMNGGSAARGTGS
jgi:prevent-host-death family protein